MQRAVIHPLLEVIGVDREALHLQALDLQRVCMGGAHDRVPAHVASQMLSDAVQCGIVRNRFSSHLKGHLESVSGKQVSQGMGGRRPNNTVPLVI